MRKKKKEPGEEKTAIAPGNEYFRVIQKKDDGGDLRTSFRPEVTRIEAEWRCGARGLDRHSVQGVAGTRGEWLQKRFSHLDRVERR